MFEAFYRKAEELAIIPVVVLERIEDAAPLAHALVAGGMPSAEVTFRTPVAADAIRAMREAEPDMCVGAGTVLTAEQLDAAIEAGAEFIVSPGFDEAIVRACIAREVPVLPAGVTPSEIIAIRNLGLTVSKFFPAAQYGGLDTIKALAAPFVGHHFMPKGGVSAANVADYLSCPHILACGGTWMVKPALFADGDFGHVTDACREAMALASAARA